MGQPIRSLGERGVIDAIRSAAPSDMNGDDAAVLSPSSFASKTVCSTDLLVEGQHFRSDWSTPYDVGRRAVVQNFADIEAMGARPVALLLGVAAPPNLDSDVLTGIARGIADEAGRWPAELVGGDVVTSERLTLSITAIGELAGPAPALSLSGAHPGQTLIASGRLGYSAAGWALLEHFGSPDAIPDSEHLQTLVDAFRVPSLARARGTVARSTGATAMTDNSDGLVVDLSTIARASHVTIDLDKDAIAPDPAVREAARLLGRDPMEWICQGGEDHALLATTGADIPSGFRFLGRVHKQGAEPLTIDGQPPTFTLGWDPFGGESFAGESSGRE
ncbi:thiamine-phosphate kinase [Corynebacterium pseudokroppenstedtii]|uniref:Thiamine-monophosphate kinase n=1 Tax=Corynebacterium pseudokroppenstedtii TaxID=2804917 RepID=A0AAU0PXZ1_9CORY|nr:thiamine-phosphate kinase [Corynebacterium pseudokroppenstedtii]QRP13667.1 thiamine-phosphate kinase [Corynebacterium kroppenstedtii]MBY0789850.1 thiamine-phosphate kinase [Corynebacterium pseudokroppenstedtii]MCF6793662.1 thiamine-phosphate kinase [Corynebacterium pseudokroppenstedtii]MCF8703801.1 thiamine-phosphate kinase [Corynebacterium pseudokroppenstedtii]MCG2637308.1 thiamine-phosphate kinase [Corynebacterium pseudokroppenstedtii]